MMTNVIIGIVGLMVLSAAFLIGYLMGVTNTFEMAERLDDDAVDYDDLYCFHCETEMPVIEHNGRLHCHNCGLLHTNDIY